MRVILAISLCGIIASGCLFLVYLSLEAQGTPGQREQDFESFEDTVNPPRENFETAEIDDEIQRLVQKLYSRNEIERLDTKARIIFLATNSDFERKRVIDSIVLSLDIPNLKYGLVDPKKYDGWMLAVMVLGEIKAFEALPDLLQCLNCNNGIGGLSIHRYPVARAVSMIGEPSVPYLEKSVQDLDQDDSSRLCTILALDSIGGEGSQRVLKMALLTEKKESFRTAIRNSLEKHQTKN